MSRRRSRRVTSRNSFRLVARTPEEGPARGALRVFGAAAACTLLALGGAHVARAPAAATHGCSARFFAGTKLLGPAALATTGTVGDELAGYRRTGSLTPRAFLARYHDASGWVYPPHGG